MQPSPEESSPLPPADDASPENQPHSHHQGRQLDMTPLNEELTNLLKVADGQTMTLGRILDELADRGHAMFILVVIGPFIFLPTTFGLSAPVGIAIAIIGLCMLIHIKPWLPDFILRKQFPYEGLEKVVGRAVRMSNRVQKIAKPRLGIMLWPGPINLTGFELTIWALLMALPGPNFLFAFMIALIAFGLLMRDGVFLLVAHILTFISPVLVWIFREPIWAFTLEMWDKMQYYWGKLSAMLG